ncbi:MAG TPA: tetratricopeptide repeat protein [Acidimicrobiales bacterium]|nr:tetratricopeptide repeat protein [Acidimicrobiales bacterium]
MPPPPGERRRASGSGAGKPRRPAGDPPRKAGGAPRGDDRPRRTPARYSEDHVEGPRQYSDDRPRRTGGPARGAGDERPRRTDGPPRTGGPRRSSDDRPVRRTDGPPRRGAGGYGDDRPRRTPGAYDDRPARRSDGPPRRGTGGYGERPAARGDGPPRRGTGGYDERPRRASGTYDERPARRSEGPPRRGTGDDRPRRAPGAYEGRPVRGSDGPSRTYGADRPPRRGAGGHSDDRPVRRGAAGTGGDDRPRRTGDGPPRRFEGRPRRDGDSVAPEARRAVARGRVRPEPEPDDARTRSWGSVARKGARVVGEPRSGSASEAWRDAVSRSRSDEERHRSAPPKWEPEVWVEDAPAPPAPRRARTSATAERAPSPPRRTRKLPPVVAGEVARAAGATRSAKVEQALAEAARAYERDRYHDARRMLRPLAERYPDVAAVRELHGLTLYRMGKWTDAIKELEAFRSLSGSYDQHPVLADCNRALRRWKRVEEVWDDLREASPSAELVAEGRIVMAGAMADRGNVGGAIALLERARSNIKRPRPHHLRLWYALADLYERAGELPRSRELFRAILRHHHDFADVPERLASLD